MLRKAPEGICPSEVFPKRKPPLWRAFRPFPRGRKWTAVWSAELHKRFLKKFGEWTLSILGTAHRKARQRRKQRCGRCRDFPAKIIALRDGKQKK